MTDSFSPVRRTRALRLRSLASVTKLVLLSLMTASIGFSQSAGRTATETPSRTATGATAVDRDTARLRAAEDEPVIAAALASVSEEVRRFNDHLTILASPWMEGRLPGTRGMELAKEYMEFHFKEAGLRAPFAAEVENADGTIAVQAFGSYRQPFKLGSSSTVEAVSLALDVAGEHIAFEHGRDLDFTVTGMGTGGKIDAPAVFVGYAIEDGPGGFSSFPEDTDLTGKVAVMLRFEPIGDNGWSKWRKTGRGWTNRAGFSMKLQAVAARGAIAAMIVNTPGTADTRASVLQPPGGSSESLVQIPVLHLSRAAGQRLVDRTTGGGASLEAWRKRADVEPLAVELDGRIAFQAKVERKAKIAENLVAVLPGRGRLSDEYVVIGAHLDHLGMGEFGSNDQDFAGKKLHPGADDNASGSAGILLIAEKMARVFAELPEDSDARSVLFIGFSAEESGLYGSRHYASNPIAPIENHILMMNFDMIGRISDKRLSLSGTDTGVGLKAFLSPILDASPLTIVERGGASGGSDHQMFYARRVPVLFAILAELHNDYHTSRDTSDLINRVDAVHAANLFFEIGVGAALRSEAFPFQRPRPQTATAPASIAQSARPAARVRLGVRLAATLNPGSVSIAAVTEGTTAAAAGMLSGDVLVAWNGRKVTDASSLSDELRKASPGDEVEMVVVRDGKRVTLDKVALQGLAPSRAQRRAEDEGEAPKASPRTASKVQFGIQPEYLAKGAGVVVDAVTADSPAAKAGIQAGDRILTWNGEEIAGAAGLGTLLRDADPGDEIEVTIDRGGKSIEAKVTLKARGN